MEELLKYMNNVLETAGIPYEFLEWTGEVTYPYFVGSLAEFEPTDEDGEEDKTFTITGFSRGAGNKLQLLNYAKQIENLFPAREGRIAVLDSGSRAVIFYAGAQMIPSGEEELTKIEINLTIKLWKVV